MKDTINSEVLKIIKLMDDEFFMSGKQKETIDKLIENPSLWTSVWNMEGDENLDVELLMYQIGILSNELGKLDDTIGRFADCSNDTLTSLAEICQNKFGITQEDFNMLFETAHSVIPVVSSVEDAQKFLSILDFGYELYQTLSTCIESPTTENDFVKSSLYSMILSSCTSFLNGEEALDLQALKEYFTENPISTETNCLKI